MKKKVSSPIHEESISNLLKLNDTISLNVSFLERKKTILANSV